MAYHTNVEVWRAQLLTVSSSNPKCYVPNGSAVVTHPPEKTSYQLDRARCSIAFGVIPLTSHLICDGEALLPSSLTLPTSRSMLSAGAAKHKYKHQHRNEHEKHQCHKHRQTHTQTQEIGTTLKSEAQKTNTYTKHKRQSHTQTQRQKKHKHNQRHKHKDTNTRVRRVRLYQLCFRASLT